MQRNQRGFTLVELMVTMVVFVLTITAAANIYSTLLNQFKQQSKISETNIEGVIGLQMLRADVEHAGFGLPWELAGLSYNEVDAAVVTGWDHEQFNDATTNPPRAFRHGDGLALNGSDILVVKATNVGLSRTASRWTYITNKGATNTDPVAWVDTTERLAAGDDYVIVIKPVAGSRQRELVRGTDFYTIYGSSVAAFENDFEPVLETYDTYLIYGIKPGASDTTPVTPMMPFNRADFYVRRPTDGMPSQCSTDAGTGILYKATVNHADGQLSEEPLLDCVRAMQVVFGRDTDNDGDSDTFGVLPLTLTAEEVRSQVKEVRIYILAQEGQRDTSYTSPSPITATDPELGQVINFAPAGDLLNFRWKIYTIIAKPYNLR